MKKYLLPENGTFYKANLHTHTTLSDGQFSPEEIKEAYMQQGYSVIAYTDHDIFIPHHDLTDENFLALSGFEVAVNEENSYPSIRDGRHKTCHLCCIAKSKDEEIQPCWNPRYAYVKNAINQHHLVKYDESKPFYERDYSAKGINDMIARYKEAGFFVTYNHPTWSLEDYRIYSKYEGMDAMEIYNHEVAVLGYPSYIPTIYDDILKCGRKVYPVAADDCHRPQGRFGGFVMIKADKLKYEKITDALSDGNFYASTGPEIFNLYVEDGRIYVECSEAVSILFNTDRRSAKAKFAENGNLITCADFPLDENDGYIRITVRDVNGNYADTRAYYTDELK